MRISVLAAAIAVALSAFGSVPGAQAGPSARYVSAGVAVARGNGSTVVDNGAVVCDDGNGVGVGGVCLPFSGDDAVSVVDDELGESLAFQVCVDNNGDGLCTTNDPDPSCADDIYFSHDDAGNFFNPVGPVRTGFRAGCPGGAFNGYVVFLCDGVHAVANDPHAHPATTGIATLTTGAEGLGDFCGNPVVSKPYFGTYPEGNLACGINAIQDPEVTGQGANGTAHGGPWHDTGPVAISCYITVNGLMTGTTPTGSGTGVAATTGQLAFVASTTDDVRLCTEVVATTSFHRCYPIVPTRQGNTTRWFLRQPVV